MSFENKLWVFQPFWEYMCLILLILSRLYQDAYLTISLFLVLHVRLSNRLYKHNDGHLRHELFI